MTQHCARCNREIPDVDDPAYVEWEVVGEDHQGHELMACPGCITHEELIEAAADFAALGERLTRCARCAKPAPADAEDEHRWLLLDTGVLVCTDCQTLEDRQRQLREDKSTAAWLASQTDPEPGQ